MSTTAIKQTKINKEDRALYRRLKREKLMYDLKYYRKLYPLLIFGIVFFAVFSYAPMYGIQLAFKHYKISAGISGSEWVGLANFVKLFARTEFWNAFRNTIILSFLKTFIYFPFPIVLAILINELTSKRLTRTLQVVFTLPHFLSWVTISGILINLLSSTGTVNSLILALGGQAVGFLNDGHIFRGLLVFTEIWKESGWTSIIYLAAIAGIDPSLYESATIDGANRFHKAWYITIPSIKNVAVILLLLSIGNAMNGSTTNGSFDQVFNLYNPSVYSTADIIDTYIYRISFLQAADYGLSTAVGLFKGAINLALLLAANFVAGKISSETKIL